MADEPGAAHQPAPPPPLATPPRPRPRWPWVVAALIVVAFVVGVLVITMAPHPDASTEDATVAAHYASIAPRVGGQVARVAVDDNQPVRAGQLLVALDPRDFQVALDQAKAQLAQDQGQVDQATAELNRQPAAIEQASAQLSAAGAARDLAAQNDVRYTTLAKTGAGSGQERQQAVAQLRQGESQVAAAAAGLVSARRQTNVLEAARRSTRGRIQADLAQIESAKLNLSYTQVRSPIDGVIDQRSVQVGNFVAPGAPVMAVVPLDGVYIEARYRELDLRHMRPGQRARVHVDAYDIWLDGTVQSIAASSGAAFSPTPASNATGNYTKIVQRLPVKIVLLPNQPLARLLRVGMSVRTKVDTGLSDVVGQQRRDQRGAITAPGGVQ